MSTYGQMQNDLQLLGMASLLNQDMGSLINKCQREEVESYPWSWLFTNVVINSVPSITYASTLTLAQNSPTATLAPPIVGLAPNIVGWLVTTSGELA